METIKTTLGRAVTAIGTINRIRQKIKGHDALNLFHMKNVLKEQLEFMTEEEEKLVEEYGGVIAEGGLVVIADKDKRAAFLKAHKELEDMECEVKTEPLSMSLDRNPDVTLEDIEQLDGFINFK